EVAGAEVVPGQLAGGLRRIECAERVDLLDLLLRDDDAVAGCGALLPELGEAVLVETGGAVVVEQVLALAAQLQLEVLDAARVVAAAVDGAAGCIRHRLHPLGLVISAA